MYDQHQSHLYSDLLIILDYWLLASLPSYLLVDLRRVKLPGCRSPHAFQWTNAAFPSQLIFGNWGFDWLISEILLSNSDFKIFILISNYNLAYTAKYTLMDQSTSSVITEICITGLVTYPPKIYLYFLCIVKINFECNAPC